VKLGKKQSTLTQRNFHLASLRAKKHLRVLLCEAKHCRLTSSTPNTMAQRKRRSTSAKSTKENVSMGETIAAAEADRELEVNTEALGKQMTLSLPSSVLSRLQDLDDTLLKELFVAQQHLHDIAIDVETHSEEGSGLVRISRCSPSA
jgi:hypothetical protein